MRRVKKLTEAELKELQFKRDWSITIFGYIKNHDDNPNDPMLQAFIDVVLQTSDRMNLSGMRVIYYDINETAKSLSRSEIKELNAILREKFGEDLNTVNKRIAARIKKIEERGYIKTEGEWRMVSEWIDDIVWDDARLKEVEYLGHLMHVYEESITVKRRSKN